jgi:hypothetical protein
MSLKILEILEILPRTTGRFRDSVWLKTQTLSFIVIYERSLVSERFERCVSEVSALQL